MLMVVVVVVVVVNPTCREIVGQWNFPPEVGPVSIGTIDGGFLSHGGTPFIIHFSRIFH